MLITSKILSGVKVQLFAIGKGGEYENYFTVFQPETFNEQLLGKIKKLDSRGKKKVTFFEIHLENFEAKNLYDNIHKNQNVKLKLRDREISIHFRNTIKRPKVFLPRTVNNSVANGWWPKIIDEGTYIRMSYSEEKYNIEEKYFFKIANFIKLHSGFDLFYLQDFLGTVIFLELSLVDQFKYNFNPETSQVSFMKLGNLEFESRVVLEAWDGEEALLSQMFDLNDNCKSCKFNIDFKPTKIGFKFYIKKNNIWKISNEETVHLLRETTISMHQKVGELKVKRGIQEEILDITTKEKPIHVSDGNDMVWQKLESERLKSNRNIEIRNLGSLFLNNNLSNEEVKKIIYEELYKKAANRIWIWDPYVDQSILSDLSVLALSNRSLKIKVLLSEYKGENITALESNLEFMRCDSINSYLKKVETDTGASLNNIEIRNWYRSGKHTFHDRFIIIDNNVWILGSSIKDIGNYHSTIYRLEGGLPQEIIDEYEKSWNGYYGPLKPNGMEVFPSLKNLL
ncbi:VPA1262 family N-terminal domain-containing protein [Lysinibacillus sphaericus]|uniref:VPA1262 family N-terminal domain-containing protein n=1 Tax=Lysinibacillus sphaericus TaxID=1421 RepID=UPI0037F28565